MVTHKTKRFQSFFPSFLLFNQLMDKLTENVEKLVKFRLLKGCSNEK